MISAQNWSTSSYYSDRLQVFISLAGDFDHLTGEPSLFYEIVTLDQDQQEIFSSAFPTLEESIVEINKRFSSWSYSPIRLEKLPANTSGCGDCSAK